MWRNSVEEWCGGMVCGGMVSGFSVERSSPVLQADMESFAPIGQFHVRRFVVLCVIFFPSHVGIVWTWHSVDMVWTWHGADIL